MAKEEAAAEQPEEGAGKSKKTLIIIIAVAVLAIAGSVAATLFFIGGGSEDAVEDAPQEDVKLPAQYRSVKEPFIVVLQTDNRQRYMQIYLAMLARDTAALDALDIHMPLIRNQLNLLFGSQDFNAMQTEEGREALRAEALTTVQGILENEIGEPGVEQVLFTNFVLQ